MMSDQLDKKKKKKHKNTRTQLFKLHQEDKLSEL